jgi:hypothetical protein
LNKIRNGGNAASFLRVNRRRVAFAATSISRPPSHREALPAGERKFQGDVGEVSGLARHFAQEAAPVIFGGEARIFLPIGPVTTLEQVRVS